MPVRALLLFLLTLASFAQSVRVYSEFERVDPFGKIVAADRADSPRELLSPALARNAWTSFLVAITPPPAGSYSLYLGLNPEKATRLEASQVLFAGRRGAWIPDGLEKLEMSPEGRLPAIAAQVPGQTVLLYWIDVFVDGDAPVRRVRLEIQMHDGEVWEIHPLELRIRPPVVPPARGPLEPLGPIEASSSESARNVLRGWICEQAVSSTPAQGASNIRARIRRNARQDAALARALEAGTSRDELIASALTQIGGQTQEAWCRAPAPPREFGAEWYLRIRDVLYHASPPPAAGPVGSAK